MKRLLLLVLPLSALATQLAPSAPMPSQEGIVLTAVRPGSAGDQAGLRSGDVVLSWRRATVGSPARAELRSPFDWTALLVEQVPRGQVELTGLRGKEARTWILPGGAPVTATDLTARPRLPADLLALLEEGETRAAAGDVDAALALWQTAADRARAGGQEALARWLELRAARGFSAAGRGEEADRAYQELALLLSRNNEGAPAAAQVLREWADTLRERQLWARAEAADRRALELDRQASPESLAAASSLTGLGRTASWGGGAQDPEPFLREALALRQRLAPGSAAVADSWWDLGNDAVMDKDYRTARERYRQAVAAADRAAPASLYAAERRVALGRAEYYLGDLEAARKTWQRALAIAEELAPEDRVTAGLLQGLSNLEITAGRWLPAAELLGRSLALCERLAIDPFALTDIVRDLALAERRLGRKAESAAHYCRALELFEGQRRQFAANPEVHLRWGATFADHYRDCAQGLVDVGRPAEAFDVLERGRARTFLNLMAEGAQRPAGLGGERAAEWQRLDGEYDRLQSALAELRSRPSQERQEISSREGRLKEIQRRKREILAESVPPGSTSYPAPLRLAAAARALDPGTLLLSFVATQDQTLLLAVQAGGEGEPPLVAVPLPVGREALGERVAAFRATLIEDRFAGRESARQGRALYDLLLRPVEPLLAGSERLLIVPDGPLHTLPFAALVHEGRFLAEEKPLHFAVSASAYAEIRKRRRPGAAPATRPVVAFADPLRHELAGRLAREPDPTLREALRRGLAPLPAARDEAAGIARLFPRARIFTGGEATEEKAKQEAGRASLLHFAVHALPDERMPANSALVLTPPPAKGEGSGNGLLQGWEIMEGLRLDADLVTLSACDTALGADMGGEGLIGLTSAFQHAGARAVVATLWGISDAPSAALMQRFYAALREGESPDEALRQAQIQQMRSRDAPEPFYWAAFQLYGDWR